MSDVTNTPEPEIEAESSPVLKPLGTLPLLGGGGGDMCNGDVCSL